MGSFTKSSGFMPMEEVVKVMMPMISFKRTLNCFMIGKIPPEEMVFSDFICTFVPQERQRLCNMRKYSPLHSTCSFFTVSFRVLPIFQCNTEISEISDMTNHLSNFGLLRSLPIMLNNSIAELKLRRYENY